MDRHRLQKAMNAFYIDRQNRLSPEDAKHALRVLRLHPGDEIAALDGFGKRYRAKLSQTEGDVYTAQLLEELPPNEPPISITVYHGIPKADKLEFLAQKLTELGVSRLVPVKMARSVAKTDGGSRTDRLQKIAREAAKQCSRALPVAVSAPVSWKQALKEMEQHERFLAPWEEPMGVRIRDLSGQGSNFGILIGPEGGIAPEEIADVKKFGAVVVTLGPRIFRTETAAVVASALVQQRWGDL